MGVGVSAVAATPAVLLRDYFQPTLKLVAESVTVYRDVYRWQKLLTAREFDDVFGHILGDAEEHFRLFDGSSAGYGRCTALEVYCVILACMNASLRDKCILMFQILKQQPPQRQEHTYSIKQHELIRSLFLAMTRGLSKVLVKHAISSDYADVLVEQAFTNCASRATKQILPTHFASWCSSYGPMQEYLVSVQQAVQEAKDNDIDYGVLYASSSLFASTAAYGADGTEAAAEHERTGDTVHIGSADRGLGTDADIFRRERWLCSAHVSAIRDAHWRDPVVSVNTTDTVSTLLNRLVHHERTALPTFNPSIVYHNAPYGVCCALLDFRDCLRLFVNVLSKALRHNVVRVPCASLRSTTTAGGDDDETTEWRVLMRSRPGNRPRTGRQGGPRSPVDNRSRASQLSLSLASTGGEGSPNAGRHGDGKDGGAQQQRRSPRTPPTDGGRVHSTIQNLFSPRTPATVTMEYSGSDSDDDDEVAGESADKLPPMSAPQSTSRRASMNSAARSITPRTAASPRFFPATPRSLTSPAAGSGVAAVVALRDDASGGPPVGHARGSSVASTTRSHGTAHSDAGDSDHSGMSPVKSRSKLAASMVRATMGDLDVLPREVLRVALSEVVLPKVCAAKLSTLVSPVTTARVCPLNLSQPVFSVVDIMAHRYTHAIVTIDSSLAPHVLHGVASQKGLLRFIHGRLREIFGDACVMTIHESRVYRNTERPLVRLQTTQTVLEGIIALHQQDVRQAVVLDERKHMVGLFGVDEVGGLLSKPIDEACDALLGEVGDLIATHRHLPVLPSALVWDVIVDLVASSADVIVVQDTIPTGRVRAIVTLTDLIRLALWATCAQTALDANRGAAEVAVAQQRAEAHADRVRTETDRDPPPQLWSPVRIHRRRRLRDDGRDGATSPIRSVSPSRARSKRLMAANRGGSSAHSGADGSMELGLRPTRPARASHSVAGARSRRRVSGGRSAPRGRRTSTRQGSAVR